MNTLLMFVPILSMFAFIACFVKLAARLLKSTAVSWKNSFLFGLLLTVLTIAKAFAGFAFPVIMPPVLAFLLGTAISLSIGTWFFSTRACNGSGVPIGWRGGFQLTGIAIGLMLAVSLSLLMPIYVFFPEGP